jgi:nucleoid-associated protein YgaU
VRRRADRLARAAALLLALALPAGATAGRLHEVKPGETLALIAGRTLGDPRLWPAIYAANRDRIKDPARVYPGQQLTIPALSEGEREAARREADARPLRAVDVGAGAAD